MLRLQGLIACSFYGKNKQTNKQKPGYVTDTVYWLNKTET